MKLSRGQKAAKFFASKEKFEKIKAESMKWGFTCNSCSERTSIWEVGGVRYKAKGEPRAKIPCPKCHQSAMQQINLQEDANSGQ